MGAVHRQQPPRHHLTPRSPRRHLLPCHDLAPTLVFGTGANPAGRHTGAGSSNAAIRFATNLSGMSCGRRDGPFGFPDRTCPPSENAHSRE